MKQTKYFILLITFLFVYKQKVFSQENKEFLSINEIFDELKSKNYNFKNISNQLKLADLTIKSSYFNIFNPKIGTSAQLIDNFNQQVSFLPGQLFGQSPGSYKEVEFGQQYVSTFSIQPQVDILNLSNIAQVKIAKINKKIVENESKILEQNIYNKSNIIYFNILSLEAQKEILIENKNIAKSIFEIVQNKYNEGIVRKQELNEANVNIINIEDKLQQLELNLKIQYNNMNLLFENKIIVKLIQNLWDFDIILGNIKATSNLLSENYALKTQLSFQELKLLKYQNLPTISLISSFNWQNSSDYFNFSSNSKWINFSYFGIKINYDFLTTTQKYSNYMSKVIQQDIQKNNEIQNKLENENINDQLNIDFQKSILQKQNLWEIYELKKDNYEKNKNQYDENILSLDKLLSSQNEMLVSNINLVMAIANIGMNKVYIDINNKF